MQVTVNVVNHPVNPFRISFSRCLIHRFITSTASIMKGIVDVILTEIAIIALQMGGITQIAGF